MKGIAIIGVVAGHIGIPIIEMFVNYWHLPVFYFVSGYFFKQKHIDEPFRYVKSRISRLLIPFFLFSIIAILTHNILVNFNIIDGIIYGVNDICTSLKDLILTFSTKEQLVGAIWFLPSLFFISLIALVSCRLLRKCFKSGNYAIRGGVICIFVGIIAVLLKLPSPLCLWQNMVVSGLFSFGFACSQNGWDQYFRHSAMLVLSSIILVIGLIFGIQVGCQAEAINHINVWYPVLFVAGIIFVFAISNRIKDSILGKVIGHIGEYSFSIMALHFIGFKIVTILHSYFDTTIDTTAFPTSGIDLKSWALIYLLTGICFPIICSKLYILSRNAWCNYCRLQKSATNN